MACTSCTILDAVETPLHLFRSSAAPDRTPLISQQPLIDHQQRNTMNPVESQGGKRKRSLSDDAPPSNAPVAPSKPLLSIPPYA